MGLLAVVNENGLFVFSFLCTILLVFMDWLNQRILLVTPFILKSVLCAFGIPGAHSYDFRVGLLCSLVSLGGGLV